MLRWYLIRTKPSGETLAQSNLQRQGYEVHLPRLMQRARRSGRCREQVVPLFPRYLFLRLDEGRQPLNPVRSTTGVSAVVRFGVQYAVVPDRVISDLRARVDPITGLHHLSDRLRLAPGADVRISEGLFDGLEGVFERQAGADRVVVLLNVLGQNASVCVRLDAVAATHAL